MSSSDSRCAPAPPPLQPILDVGQKTVTPNIVAKSKAIIPYSWKVQPQDVGQEVAISAGPGWSSPDPVSLKSIYLTGPNSTLKIYSGSTLVRTLTLTGSLTQELGLDIPAGSPISLKVVPAAPGDVSGSLTVLL